MKELLWLDDEIDHLSSFANEIESMGVIVKVCKSFDEGLELLQGWTPDTFIVDLNLPEDDDNGIEFLRVVTREFPDSTHVALSSYLYRKSYISALSDIEHPVLQLDKILPPPKSGEFKTEFLDLIHSFAEDGKLKKPESLSSGLDPFQVTFKEWRSLSVLERDELDDAAELTISDELNQLFSGNAVWVLYCGSSKRPKAVVEDFADIWSDEEIIRFGRKQGFAPYTFLGPATIAEIWSAGCHPNDCGHNDGFSGYPTVRFSLTEDKNMDSHFDTGSNASYFDYDGFRQLGFVNQISAWSNLTLMPTRKRVKVRKERRELLLKSQVEGGDASIVEVNATFVRDWSEFPYSKICGPSCKQHQPDQPGKTCDFRSCLLGRDILNNDVQVVLDSRQKKTLIGG